MFFRSVGCQVSRSVDIRFCKKLVIAPIRSRMDKRRIESRPFVAVEGTRVLPVVTFTTGQHAVRSVQVGSRFPQADPRRQHGSVPGRQATDCERFPNVSRRKNKQAYYNNCTYDRRRYSGQMCFTTRVMRREDVTVIIPVRFWIDPVEVWAFTRRRRLLFSSFCFVLYAVTYNIIYYSCIARYEMDFLKTGNYCNFHIVNDECIRVFPTWTVLSFAFHKYAR